MNAREVYARRSLGKFKLYLFCYIETQFSRMSTHAILWQEMEVAGPDAQALPITEL